MNEQSQPPAKLEIEEIKEQFDELQRKLPELWGEIGRHYPGGSCRTGDADRNSSGQRIRA